MLKDLIFYLLWYNVIRWSSHICNFLSVLCEWSLLNNTGKVVEENWESVRKLNGVKNAIMQVTYFLIGLMFSLLFYCHNILYWEKVTSYEKFSYNLTNKIASYGPKLGKEKTLRYTNADLKTSLYVCVHIKTISWKSLIL